MPGTKNPPAGSHGGRASVSLVDADRPTLNHPESQPATVHQVRALHLIARHHARPELALALAALCYGEAR